MVRPPVRFLIISSGRLLESGIFDRSIHSTCDFLLTFDFIYDIIMVIFIIKLSYYQLLVLIGLTVKMRSYLVCVVFDVPMTRQWCAVRARISMYYVTCLV